MILMLHDLHDLDDLAMILQSQVRQLYCSTICFDFRAHAYHVFHARFQGFSLGTGRNIVSLSETLER